MDMPPELVIVGVDIGFTCTGVAVYAHNMPKPAVVQKWPGSDNIVHKVPTSIAYVGGISRPQLWGLECPGPGNIGPGMFVRMLFKFFLDEENLQVTTFNIDDVKAWYRDFLGKLYEHVLAQLKARWQVDSKSTKVEYIFSLPTAWREKDKVVERFKDILNETGFGGSGSVGNSENSSMTIGLSEAEAAAVYTAMRREHEYKEGDALLVCDAGGGTTDVCALKVNRTEGKVIEMGLLDTPKFLFVGSVNIDEAFERKVEQDLIDLKHEHPALSKHVAQHMAQGDFREIKLDFGKRELVAPIAKLSVPGLPDNCHMFVEFSRDEIKAMFDKQLVRIFELIDMELKHLQQTQPGLTVSYIVLSGGLGSSKYVQAEFETRYGDMKVLFDEAMEEPPLAVCKGLVLDRMHRICHGTSVLRTRRCRASYGILYSERYDPNRHRDQTPEKNPLDGRLYVTKKIDWFIRKGDVITEGVAGGVALTHSCSRIIASDCPGWHDTVVTSHLPQDLLPQFLGQGYASVVCTVVSNLGPAELSDDMADIETRRRWGVFGKKYRRAKYELLVFVDGESLKFRTRVNREERSETEPVKAPWMFTQDAEEGK